jgi:hypothetical protein
VLIPHSLPLEMPAPQMTCPILHIALIHALIDVITYSILPLVIATSTLLHASLFVLPALLSTHLSQTEYQTDTMAARSDEVEVDFAAGEGKASPSIMHVPSSVFHHQKLTHPPIQASSL